MICTRTLHACSAFLFALAASTPAFAGILYVDASATSGANDGSSWADAFQGPSGLRLALAAAVAGDEIWVADGTYLPTLTGVRARSLDLKSDVKLYGGFAGGETSVTQRNPSLNVAVLSGDLAGDDGIGSYGDNSYHVVEGDDVENILIDGFTIRGGNADAVGDDGGGGLFFHQGASNVAVRVVQCVFEGNRCTGLGGAVLVEQSCCYFLFEDCRFVDNHGGAGGGAVQLTNSGDASWFARCIFSGNSAPDGSALRFTLALDVFFDDCRIDRNTATGASIGGAVYVHAESYPWFISCTVASNIATSATAAGLRGGESFIRNSIFYFNTGPGGSQTSANQIYGASVFPRYSCIQGGYAGTAVISSDPLLVDEPGGDFRLTPASPCVDSGDNSLVGSALDLDRTARYEDVAATADGGAGTAPIVDRGAYEAPGGLYQPFCAGDGSLATACPCGNTGSLGHGCRHSQSGSDGALLAVAGTSTPDTVVLTTSELRGGVLCIFLQGNVPISAGVVFGDGVRCVGGALKRIGSKNASATGIASYPGPGDPSVSARSATTGDPIPAGAMRWYQTWYRDNSSTFCPPPQGSSSNVSSGAIVQW